MIKSIFPILQTSCLHGSKHSFCPVCLAIDNICWNWFWWLPSRQKSKLFIHDFLWNSTFDWIIARSCGNNYSSLFMPVIFSSCQQNLIKTFQIESMIALITKMTLIFFLRLVKWPKKLSKKAKIFRNFRNKSSSILMLHKINKNKKCASKLIFFNENFF